MMAARWRHLLIVRVLLEKNANVELADIHSRTALFFSTIQSNPKVARFLVEEGKAEIDHADIDCNTSLLKAIEYGHYVSLLPI